MVFKYYSTVKVRFTKASRAWKPASSLSTTNTASQAATTCSSASDVKSSSNESTADSASPGVPAVDLSLLGSIHDPDICSVSFLPSGASSAIFASHTILAVRSPFFSAKFRREWVASVANHEPIKLPTWDLAAFAVIVAHLYSRWVPSESSTVPDAVKSALARMGVQLSSLEDFDVLTNCFDLAEYLECTELVSALEPLIVASIAKRVRAVKLAPTKFSSSATSHQ
ncbi:hypothetical protein H9P43_007384 [Blastocladiella emersonii ATCC 22665]|nr:hypothetical protein H9P43_007370 [Blastocladiella emersonii ATCC 22665]KAI9173253.1 hypothetical protein H9P43_007384 [Blastocladiella emersonii ATCC 22665]